MSAAVSIRRLETSNTVQGEEDNHHSKNALLTMLAYQTFFNNEEMEAKNRKEQLELEESSYFPQQWYESFHAIITQSIPTIFGVFINILDACTFGTVFFPSYMGNTSHLVVELFLLSTVFSQVILIYMSSFQSALGTSMAENIPFIHSMCNNIFTNLKNDPFLDQKLLPTALVAVSLSVIVNGGLFIVLGLFQLGNILHFFPRYVILGLNAGFGVFLIGTAFEISTGLPMTMISLFQLSNDMIMQIMISIFIEMILRLLAFAGINEIIISLVMFFIPILFFFVLYCNQITIQEARTHLWLFPESDTSTYHWYNTWDNYFEWQYIDWDVLFLQIPTIGLLALFTMILVPVRIPSLALITNEEVVFDQELIAQGIGNILSGLFGCPHNYLSYSNSIFFHILHGKGKSSRLVLTILTFSCFFIGSSILNYIPRVIASLIMVHLGIDLLITALIENSKTLTYLEFFCMFFVCIIVVSFGFVMGMCIGILLACVTFVIASSNEQNIRSIFIGHEARSDTQWSQRQEEKLSSAIEEQTAQIYVIELQGHLFFGNIQRVVTELQQIIDPAYSTPAVKQEMSRRYSIYGRQRSKTTVSALDGSIPVHHSTVRFSASNDTQMPSPDVLSPPSNENVTKLTNVVLDCTFLAGADINAVSGLYKFKEKYENYLKNNSNMNSPNPTYPNSENNSARYSNSPSRIASPPPLSIPRTPRSLFASSQQFQIVFAGLLPSLQEIFEIIEKKEYERRRKQQKNNIDDPANVIEFDKPPPPPVRSPAPRSPSVRNSLQREASSERQLLLPKIASSKSMPRIASQSSLIGKYQWNVLRLSKSYYPDVNSALHAIEEELLEVLPDISPSFTNSENLLQLMNLEFQGILERKQQPLESFSREFSDGDYSEVEEEEVAPFGDEEELSCSFSAGNDDITPQGMEKRKSGSAQKLIVPREESSSFDHQSPTKKRIPSGRLSLKRQKSVSSSGSEGISPSNSGSILSPSIKSIRYFNQRKKKILDCFQQLGSNLWEDYDQPLLEQLANKFLQFPITTYQSEEQIWKKGSEANELGVLLEGRICSLLANGSSFQTVLSPALIGLSCIVKEKTRTRTLVAVDDDTKIIMIPYSFICLLEETARPLHSILVTMALRGLYFRQKNEYSLFHAGSMTNLLTTNS